MQVFKVYFQILRRHLSAILLYSGIFIVVIFGFILPNTDNDPAESFTASECRFAVFDYDQSAASEALIGWLSEKHELTSIADDKKETVQDELYNRNVYSVLRISEGYEEALQNGAQAEELAKFLEILTIPGTLTGELFETDLNRYLTVQAVYRTAGASVSEAGAAAEQALQTGITTVFPEERSKEESKILTFLKYLSWIFIAMCVESIAPVLCVFQGAEVRRRLSCSSYPFHRMSREILLGVFVTGLGILLVFGGLAGIVFSEEMFCAKGGLYLLNMFVYLLVALAITYLASQLVNSPNSMALSMIANIVSLGMSFLCGIFVPAEYLSDTVLKIAHFLPAYWYQKTLQELDGDYSGRLGIIFGNIGILLLFAAALVAVGIVISRQKVRQKLA